MVLPLIWILTDPRSLIERIRHYFTLKSLSISLAELFLLVAGLASREFLPWPKTGIDNLMIFFGLILFFSGMFLAVWAKIAMKTKWGLPGEHDIKRQNEILDRGPFAISRNPIYIGLISVILGYTLALRSWAIFLVPFVIFYFYKAILKEERNLTKYFGKKYLDYKSKVPRFI